MTTLTRRKTRVDWAHFLKDIATRYPDARRITLVLDNLNTHRSGALYEAFVPREAKALRDQFVCVHSPKRQLAQRRRSRTRPVMIRQCLDRRIEWIDTLRIEVACWRAARD